MRINLGLPHRGNIFQFPRCPAPLLESLGGLLKRVPFAGWDIHINGKQENGKTSSPVNMQLYDLAAD